MNQRPKPVSRELVEGMTDGKVRALLPELPAGSGVQVAMATRQMAALHVISQQLDYIARLLEELPAAPGSQARTKHRI